MKRHALLSLTVVFVISGYVSGCSLEEAVDSMACPDYAIQLDDGTLCRANDLQAIPCADYAELFANPNRCPAERPACSVIDAQNVCVQECRKDQALCNTQCIDPNKDANYCGATGRSNTCGEFTKCKAYEKCEKGACLLDESQYISCVKNDGTAAILPISELEKNPEHCGQCNHACPSEYHECRSGECLLKEGYIQCTEDGTPVILKTSDLQSHNSHCGNCDTVCEENNECIGGNCMLKDGFTQCTVDGNDIVIENATLKTSNQHCGACNNACQTEYETCQNGTCIRINCSDQSACFIENELLCVNGVEKCGPECTNCQKDPNAYYRCVHGTCEFLACHPQYHHVDSDDPYQICVPDRTTECGDSLTDCTQLTYWQDGVCRNGRCWAMSCNSSAPFKPTLKQGVCSIYLTSMGCFPFFACDTTGVETIDCTTCKAIQCLWGYHLTPEGTCVINTSLSRGNTTVADVTNCNEIPGSVRDTAYCTQNENTCAATMCADGYQLNPLDYTCEASYETACVHDDESLFFCNQNIAGWSDGKCVANVCQATRCMPGFHIAEGTCEPNSDTRCGQRSSDQVIDCNEQLPDNADKMFCTYDGNCLIKRCQQGYHLSKDKTLCIPNNTSDCGPVDETGINCPQFPYAKTMKCNEYGQCAIDTCQVLSPGDFDRNLSLIDGKCLCPLGFHLDTVAQTCVADTNEACGNENTVNCTKLTGWLNGDCNLGVCKIIQCIDGYSLVTGTDPITGSKTYRCVKS